MSRDDMYDIIIGAAAVTIAYMLWKQHKGQGGTCTGCGGGALPSTIIGGTGPTVNVPAPIPVGGNDKTGYWYDLDNLTAGVLL